MAPRIVMKSIVVVTFFAILLAIVLKTAQSEECNHFANMSNPYCFSDGYPNVLGKQCFLTFEAPPGRRIYLVFVSFSLNQENCSSEYIALYDGDSTSDKLLGRFCKVKKPHPIISTGHRLLLVFRLMGASSNFGIQQSTDIHFVKVTEDVDVESPNYPMYRPNVLHTWEFETVPGDTIILEFRDFALEVETNCLYDYVELYGGKSVNDVNDHYLGRFCGSEIPRAIKSRTERMIMIFRSDGSSEFIGFRATLKSVPSEIKKFERNITHYLLNTRINPTNVINKWGTDITRIAVALYLTDGSFFASNNETGKEIAYELILQMMSKLVMKKRTSAKDLAQFINAMIVACIDPKKFFGVNIVNELRKRIDSNSITNPFFILTLCNAGENMTFEYIHKLQKIFDAHLRPTWTDSQSIVVMALKCISKRFNMNLNTTLEKMVTELKRKQQHNGIIDNLENTALVIQALIATENYESNFSLSIAIESIIKDVKLSDVSIEEIYYILPILKFRTLLKINSDHCENFIKTDTASDRDLEEIKNLREQQPDERIQVQIAIVIGDDMDFSSTRKIKVSPDYSFYQALENISASEPEYKIRYKIAEKKPYVAAVGTFKDSTADGMFWFVYTRPLSSTIDPILVTESPVDIKVKENEELILWYRSERRPITEGLSSDITDAPSQSV